MKEFKQELPLPDKPAVGIILHAYQPPYPVQTPDIIDRIVNNTYLPLPKALLEANIPVTVNINASLTEILETDYPEVIEGFNDLHDAGLLEFLGSACYHPILPLIPAEESRKQIKLNEKINRRVFGNRYQTTGFFPPELAVSPELVPLLKSLDYKYMIIPLTSVFGITSKKPFFRIKGFIGVTRDKDVSNRLSFKDYPDEKEFVNHVINQQFYFQSPTVLAMDMETFGEHHSGYYKFLVKCLAKCRVGLIRDLINKERTVTPLSTFRSSSWSTSIDEAVSGNSLPLWDNPSNAFHQLQNLHLQLVNDLAGKLPSDELDSEIIRLVAKSQTSCQFWWASSGRFSREIIMRGIQLQRQALEALTGEYPEEKAQIWLNISDKIIERLKRILKV